MGLIKKIIIKIYATRQVKKWQAAYEAYAEYPKGTVGYNKAQIASEHIKIWSRVRRANQW